MLYGLTFWLLKIYTAKDQKSASNVICPNIFLTHDFEILEKKNIKKWRVVLKFCAKIGGRKGASGILCNWKIGCKVDVWWIRKVKINEKLNSGTPPPQTSQTAIIWGHTQLWFKVTRRVKWKKGNDLQCTLQVSLKKSSFRKKR